jgi:hypothetical protein
MPASLNKQHCCLASSEDEQERPRIGLDASPPFFWFRCGDAMLRSLFSEERANPTKNVCWCGAAHKALAVCEAKRGFLFQFCTTPV